MDVEDVGAAVGADGLEHREDASPSGRVRPHGHAEVGQGGGERALVRVRGRVVGQEEDVERAVGRRDVSGSRGRGHVPGVGPEVGDAPMPR